MFIGHTSSVFLKGCGGAGRTFRRRRHRSDGSFDNFWWQWSLPAAWGAAAACRCCSRDEDTSRAGTYQWRTTEFEGTVGRVEVCLVGSILRRSGTTHGLSLSLRGMDNGFDHSSDLFECVSSVLWTCYSHVETELQMLFSELLHPQERCLSRRMHRQIKQETSPTWTCQRDERTVTCKGSLCTHSASGLVTRPGSTRRCDQTAVAVFCQLVRSA